MKNLIKITFTIVFLIIYGTTFSQTWITTESSPNGARAKAETTMLNDGRIIVTGGAINTVATEITEIYDPIADTWTRVADLPAPVVYHASVCVSDSTILLFGGKIGEKTTANVWEYNINTDTWTQKEDMPIDIIKHSVTVLQNSTVLIGGGYSLPSNEESSWSFIYNPKTNTYSDNINLLTKRTGHSAVLLNDGNVMYLAGYNYVGGGAITDIEIFDTQAQSWSVQGEISTGRTGGQEVVKTQSGDIFVIGGFNGFASLNLDVIDKYNAETQTWTTIQNLPQATSGTNVALLENGEILVAGGRAGQLKKTSSLKDKNGRFLNPNDFNSKEMSYIKTVFSINTETGEQTTLNELSTERSHAEVFKLNDNRIIVLYGEGASYFDYGEIYGTATEPLTYNVTFHIFENDGTTPANEVSIQFNSETLQTNASGEITFSNVEIGNGLPFIATKNGFENYTGSVSVTSNDINIYVTLQPSTAIQKISKQFSIYPNPSNGIFTIENLQATVAAERSRSTRPCSVSITDITGKTIYTSTVNSKSTIINLKNQPAGIYFINISIENQIFTQQLIIQ